MKELEKNNEKLRQAVADIKAAILQGQYEACKETNRIQLGFITPLANMYRSIRAKAFGVQEPWRP